MYHLPIWSKFKIQTFKARQLAHRYYTEPRHSKPYALRYLLADFAEALDGWNLWAILIYLCSLNFVAA